MDRPIHILHVFPTFTSGGSQRRFATIANRFGKRFRHSIVAVNGAHDAASLLDSGLDVERVPQSPRRNSLQAPLYYAELIRRLRPDVLETYNWGAMDAVIGALLAGFRSVIHTEDGFNPDEAVRLKSRRVLTRKLVLNRIYKTVMPSRTLQKIALEQYRLAPDRIQLIPNGVDLERFRPRDGCPMRARLGIGEREFVVGAVGRLSREKDYPLLVRAFAATGWNDARLVIVGGGAEEGAIRAAAESAGVASRLIVTGAVEDTAPLYPAFDVFAISSATEQMPLALLEAMASGLPALSTDVGDCAAILQADGPPEIVPRAEPDRLAEALRHLRDDAALRCRLALKNRSRAEQEYPLERMFQAYCRLYEEAAALQNRGTGVPLS